ncbi:hypothetical protein AB0K48_37210 [Nonomuraea sp. NPDC055795]|uniref:Uncharacterized protein n=1 Tax=Nonomuraea endophytica TaxID=714136 RepID=A0A7W8EIT5_9ACTN|nr:hypothetical protein [Nonomuraea endophytica]MBB5079977.1 hypothetical protein [Nonomuraea endophytica]
MATDTASRVDALEVRVNVLEEARDTHEEAIYKVHRSTVKLELGVDRLLDIVGGRHVTEAEVDEELDGR